MSDETDAGHGWRRRASGLIAPENRLIAPRRSRVCDMLGVNHLTGFGAAGNARDPYFANVVLLLHFDGTHGATSFIDSSSAARTISVSGDPAISNAESKFGGTSGLLGGSSDLLTAPNSSDFEFGTGDFTVEWWEYRTAATVACPVFSRGPVGSNPIMVGYSNSTNVVVYSYTTTPWDLLSAFVLGSVALNAWTHFALTRSGTFFYGFKDGALTTTSGSTAAAIAASSATISVGGEVSTASTFPGYLDELRITKGVARYTAAFTPAVAPFPNN